MQVSNKITKLHRCLCEVGDIFAKVDIVEVTRICVYRLQLNLDYADRLHVGVKFCNLSLIYE
jgi:hypothetical protein